VKIERTCCGVNRSFTGHQPGGSGGAQPADLLNEEMTMVQLMLSSPFTGFVARAQHTPHHATSGKGPTYTTSRDLMISMLVHLSMALHAIYKVWIIINLSQGQRQQKY